jgi:predicted MFS family arabinose efflux permease
MKAADNSRGQCEQRQLLRQQGRDLPTQPPPGCGPGVVAVDPFIISERRIVLSAGSQTQISTKRVILTVLVPFGLGYYLSYLYRTVNLVISPDLAADLALNSTNLGLLTAVYFIAFAAFQTPLGVLLDQYGPRRVQSALLIFAAAGSALFAFADDFTILAIGRGLIGFGVSGCLMAALKANVLWFPRERLSLFNGLTVAFGAFGALSATVPVEILLNQMGWRTIFSILSGMTILVAVLTYLVVPERGAPQLSARRGTASISEQLRGLSVVYKTSFFWRISLVTFIHNGTYLAYQSLWMGPWLRDVGGFAGSAIADMLLWFNAGMFAGVIGIGVLADRLQRFGIKPIVMVGVGIFGSIVVQLMLALEAVSFALPLCVAFGFFGSSTLLAYSVFGQHFAVETIGRVNTAQNMLTFIAAFAVQWGVGAIIGLWPVLADGRYDPAGHQAALLMMVGLETIAFVWFVWPRRETVTGSGE